MGDAPSLRESAIMRLSDVLRALNDDLRKADDGVFGLETRIALLEDNLRETVCALLGATNPVVLESNRKDGASHQNPPPGDGQ
jgi:hypothetical protein